jgi:uncharacterized membrane protein YfcA
MSISIIIAGLITGMLLGVFGSGGSIITMPALLYLLDVEPKLAIAMSLGIVAITATITAMQHWRHGHYRRYCRQPIGASLTCRATQTWFWWFSGTGCQLYFN